MLSSNDNRILQGQSCRARTSSSSSSLTNLIASNNSDNENDTNSEGKEQYMVHYNLGPNAPKPGFIRKLLPRVPWNRIPDWLTYLRCLAIPLLLGVFNLSNRHVETCAIFSIASFTDWLDGYLARRWDITSDFGAFLDPVADKLMVSTALILLSGRYGPIISIPTSIILAREISVSALREWMAQRQCRDAVQVGYQGKVKTALTMVSLIVLLLVPSSSSSPLSSVAAASLSSNTDVFLSKLYKPGLFLLYMSTLITITSGSIYFKAAAPILFGQEKSTKK